MKKVKYGTTDVKLSVLEEASCGVLGGALACWNHPIEVARIEMQARQSMFIILTDRALSFSLSLYIYLEKGSGACVE